MPPLVEGLTALETGTFHRGRLAGSKFALPPGFDANKYASKWVTDGPEVIEASQDQILESAGCKAQGWAVYKTTKTAGTGKEGDKPSFVPVTRIVGKVTYVLLYRPKALQVAVNKIYADQSRILTGAEVRGETNSANINGDAGVLTNADLARMQRFNETDPGGSYIPTLAEGQPTRLQEAGNIPVQ